MRPTYRFCLRGGDIGVNYEGQRKGDNGVQSAKQVFTSGNFLSTIGHLWWNRKFQWLLYSTHTDWFNNVEKAIAMMELLLNLCNLVNSVNSVSSEKFVATCPHRGKCKRNFNRLRVQTGIRTRGRWGPALRSNTSFFNIMRQSNWNDTIGKAIVKHNLDIRKPFMRNKSVKIR